MAASKLALSRQYSAMSTGSDDSDDMLLFPITDLNESESSDHERESEESGSERKPRVRNSSSTSSVESVPVQPRAFMPLRQRRLTKGLAAIDVSSAPISVNRRHWLSAIRKARKMADPWESFHIDKLPAEKALRHRYNALRKSWTTDDCLIKMENKAFNRGAMRQCYRLKKTSNFTKHEDWKHSANYVAKQYIEIVNREVYFEDVRLQMDAKLWGEEYNRHNPPKKVDIFQMYILEFIDREGSPLYHLEHFIEGDYIKYNSNSGFVEENLRLTPHAFSHFTFERSGHQLIIVDIQGVGDLYTDPQIHTAVGDDYGDGNLGPKGFALFFYSHVCNSICETMGLSQFDLSLTEKTVQKPMLKRQLSAKTMIRGYVEHCYSASPRECIDLTSFLARQRSSSSYCSNGSTDESPIGSPMAIGSTTEDDLTEEDPLSPDSTVGQVRLRVRYASESESTTMTEEEEREAFQRAMKMKARPSCILNEMNLMNMAEKKIGDSILGKVHHEMAKYHEICRFSKTETDIDWGAALFHEEYAAQLSVLEAILTLAKLYLGMPRDVLLSCTVPETEEHINKGVDYMAQAADAADRGAMLYMARAFETGTGLGTQRSKSWEDALAWYQDAEKTMEVDEGGEYDSTMDDPVYQLQAKQAELLRYGGFGLAMDPNRAGDLYNEAAESAMAAMKGRLANKYYMLAEECYGEVEEDEEDEGVDG